MARKVEQSGNTKLDIAVQIIIPGGKNVIKILSVRDAILKLSRVACNLDEGPCNKCSLNHTDICETVRYDEGYMKQAAKMLDALFDKRLGRIAKKQGWEL